MFTQGAIFPKPALDATFLNLKEMSEVKQNHKLHE